MLLSTTGSGSSDPLAEQIAELRRNALASLPSQLKQLSLLVRRSVATGRLGALRRWCQKHGLTIERSKMRQLRDFLITRLPDLYDLEPAARARLRAQQLRGQDTAQMTEDYREGLARNEDLRCRACRYFVIAPGDGDPKSCVSLGTKGADAACYGFTRREDSGV
jgi:hypothetical protein